MDIALTFAYSLIELAMEMELWVCVQWGHRQISPPQSNTIHVASLVKTTGQLIGVDMTQRPLGIK